MDAKPPPEREPLAAPPEAPVDRPAPDHLAETLVPDELPEDERVDRQNDLA